MSIPPDRNQTAFQVLTLEELERLPARPKRGVARIEMASNPVTVRGEALDEIWWRGKQWAVTAHGIECLDGTYQFDAARLAENPDYLWPKHMDGKDWVDIEEFSTAWMVALLLHGQADKIGPAELRKVFAQLRPIRGEEVDAAP